MILLECDHGFISSRYIIRFRESTVNEGGWTVYYQTAADVTTTHCSRSQAAEFFEALKRQGR